MKRSCLTWICLPILIFIISISETRMFVLANENFNSTELYTSEINTKIEAHIKEHEATTAALSVAVFQNSDGLLW